MKELVNYINQTTVCTIAPSSLGGVGVFAIKDIKAGDEVTFDYRSKQRNFHQLTKDHMPFLWT